MSDCEIDPHDIDMDYPMEQTPFFKWLDAGNGGAYFEEAVRTYLHWGLRPRPTNLTGRDVNCLRCTHSHYYWLKAIKDCKHEH